MIPPPPGGGVSFLRRLAFRHGEGWLGTAEASVKV
jgi:hypothetical protein